MTLVVLSQIGLFVCSSIAAKKAGFWYEDQAGKITKMVGIITKMWLAGDVSKFRLGGMPIRMFGILAIWKMEVGRGEILTNFCSQSGRLMILSTAQRCVAGCDRYMVVVTALAKLISKLKTLLVND